MKRKNIVITIIIVIAAILIAKILYLKLMDDIYENVENFTETNNRYYKVEIIQENTSRTEEVFVYGDVVKYNIYIDGVKTITQWKDFSTGEEYDINFENKQIYDSDMLLKNQKFMPNLSHFIYYIKEFGFLERLSKVYYVLPVNYDGIKCYKIVTSKEELIVDRENLLPVYGVTKIINTNKKVDGEIEYKYSFNIGNVKSEDVELEDIKGFEVIKNRK